MNYKRILSAALAIFICLLPVCSASAGETPVMEVYFDSDNYSKGDIVAADIIVYNATYNVLGFSIGYGDNVTVVDENGDKSDNGAALVKIHDELYRGEGIFSVLTADVTENNIKSIVYVNPNTTSNDVKNNSVSAGNEGRKVATLYFEMASDGVPDVNFAVIPGDAEFDSSAFFMLDDGKNPEGSVSKITYRKEEKPVDQKDTANDDKIKDVTLSDEPDKTPANEQDAPDKNNDTVVIMPENTDPEGIIPEGSIIADISSADDGNISDDTAVGENKDPDDGISPVERAVGIGILGFAFGIAGAIVFKKIMDGVRNKD